MKEFVFPRETAGVPATTRTTRCNKKRNLDEDETSNEATSVEGDREASGDSVEVNTDTKAEATAEEEA